MKARQLLAGSILNRTDLQVILAAFDDAWRDVVPLAGVDWSDQEAARLRLASIMLSFQKDGPLDAVELRDKAIAIYRAGGD